MIFNFQRTFTKPSFSSLQPNIIYPLNVTNNFINFGLALICEDYNLESVVRVDSNHVKYIKQHYATRLADPVYLTVNPDHLILDITLSTYTFVQLGDTVRTASFYDANTSLSSYDSSYYIKNDSRAIYHIALPHPYFNFKLWWDGVSLGSLADGINYINTLYSLPFSAIYEPSKYTPNIARQVASIPITVNSDYVTTIPTHSSSFYQLLLSYKAYYFDYPRMYAEAVAEHLVNTTPFNPPTIPTLHPNIINSANITYNYTLTSSILAVGTPPQINW